MMLVIRKLVAVAVLLFACSILSVMGQVNKDAQLKVVWSPSDKSFSVETPVALLEQKSEYDDKSEPQIEPSRAFGAETSEYTFLITVFGLRKEDIGADLEEKFGGVQFLIGGDDDHDFTERLLKINGLNAKEVVYRKQNNRGLIIDAGARIYVLGLAVKERKYLDSEVANRFFRSFRLLKRSKTR